MLFDEIKVKCKELQEDRERIEKAMKEDKDLIELNSIKRANDEILNQLQKEIIVTQRTDKDLIRQLNQLEDKYNKQLRKNRDKLKYSVLPKCYETSLVQTLPEKNAIPDKLLKHLYPYQIATVNALLTSNPSESMRLPPISVLENPVGTGKTRCSLVYATLLKGKTLIVVPQTLLKQWQIEVTKLELGEDVSCIMDVRGLKKISQSFAASAHISIIGSSTVSLHLLNYWENLKFQNVMIDELETFRCFDRVYKPSIVKFKRMLLITATLSMDIRSNLFDRNGWYDQTRLPTDSFDPTRMSILCDKSFIEDSFKLPPLVHTKLICKGLADHVLLATLSTEILDLIRQGDTNNAILLAGGSSKHSTVLEALDYKWTKCINNLRKHIRQLKRQLKKPFENVNHNNVDLLEFFEQKEAAKVIDKGKDRIKRIDTKEENEDEEEKEEEYESDNEEYLKGNPDDIICDGERKKTRKEIQKEIKEQLIELEKVITRKDSVMERGRQLGCGICMDSEGTNPVLVNCCSNSFCLDCYMQLVHQNFTKCPMCQNKLGAYTIVTKGKEVKDEGKDEMKDKKETLIDLLKGFPKDSVLMFSENNNTFKLQKEFEKHGIKSEILCGHSTTIQKTIQKHKDKEFQVLFINSKFLGAGIHLAHTDRIILYHALQSRFDFIQVIGRAHRLPRTKQLNVYHLLERGEKPVYL